ncbi:MAG: hypothetical protein SGJ19_08675, partial [Planctomycetia bacterium]|nr:hypothetical protein [Planctomycetia bacterium]
MSLDSTQSFDETTPIWDAPAKAPVDEEFPPKLPEPPAPARLGSDALTKLRELFACLSQPVAGSGVLAMLSEPRTFKAGGTTRASMAELCGYASELEFFKESQPIATKDSHSWFATSDKVHGGWVIWCDQE